ncbi:MAG: 1-acyl-sn-glycerol-3-phosphate acyltransferase [Bacteroidales bacterium]|jgi:1-acyl-sn-glycerol-3-phosphate acyltransferase|nr:1-acyl-sn-glycerol-3-phosphate acyltransferase [Bacteroidales bacterium]
MYRHLSSIYLCLLFFVTSLIFFVIAIILRVTTVRFDRKLTVLHLFSCFWAACYTWLNPLWRVSITGRDNIDTRKVYVMVSNHQSVVDILVLYRIFKPYKWVGKASLFKIPLLGWNMSMNKYIKIVRSSVSSQRRMIRLCSKNIGEGNSIMIFPEGTRSANGELRNFKEGAFLIAMQQKVDIIPMVINGTANALPPKGYPFNPQKMRLHILPPVPYETYRDMTVAEVSGHVRQIMADELNRMRK